MSRLHRVSPASLKGDDGWRLRDTYSDLIKDIERYGQLDILLFLSLCSLLIKCMHVHSFQPLIDCPVAFYL